MLRLRILFVMAIGFFVLAPVNAKAEYVDGMSFYRAYFAPRGVDPSGMCRGRCEVDRIHLRREARKLKVDRLSQFYRIRMEVDFSDQEGANCGCCQVVWQIKWNIGGLDHFDPGITPGTWVEDRSQEGERFGYRQGEFAEGPTLWETGKHPRQPGGVTFSRSAPVIDFETGEFPKDELDNVINRPVHSDGYFDIDGNGIGVLNRATGCHYGLEDNPTMGFDRPGLVLSFRALIWDSCNEDYVASSGTVDLKYFGNAEPVLEGDDAQYGIPVFTDKINNIRGIRALNEHFDLPTNNAPGAD